MGPETKKTNNKETDATTIMLQSLKKRDRGHEKTKAKAQVKKNNYNTYRLSPTDTLI